MGLQIIVSVLKTVEIPKLHKIGYGVCSFRSMRLCFGVFNGIKGQIIQSKATIRGVDMSLNIFCEARKHVKNECE